MLAKGYQQDTIENEEVYSPVARITTLRVLLCIACITGRKFEQMDVETAFLNRKIKSEVYIYPLSDGYEIDIDTVCLLRKWLFIILHK